MIYHIYLKLSIFFVLLLFSTALIQILLQKTNPVSKNQASLLLILLLTITSFLRLVYIQTSDLDVDTSTWLSAVISVNHYPSKLWVLLNYSDSRPLTVLPPLIATWLGFPAAYVMSETVGIILWIGTIYLLYRMLVLLGSRTNALILTWSLCLFLSTMSYRYSVYNSEHVSILMLTAAFGGYVAYTHEKWNSPLVSLILGMILGSLVYAKFQNVPMGMLTGLFLMIEMAQRKNWKNLIYLIGGAMFPTALINLYYASTSSLEVFWNNYFWNNFYYSYTTQFSNMPVFERFSPRRVFRFLLIDTNISYYFVTLTGVILLSVVVNRTSYFSETDKNRKILLASILTVIASIYSVLQSGNNFDHYKLYMIVPYVFLAAILITANTQKVRKLLLPILILGSLSQAALNIKKNVPHDNPESLSTLDKKVVRSINSHSHANDRIVVWGWRDQLYVKAGRAMGYRDAHMFHFSLTSPLIPSWTRDFLEDMESNKPKLFIDVVLPNYSTRGNLLLPHDKVPGVRAYVKQNFRLVQIIDSVRIFKRIEK